MSMTWSFLNATELQKNQAFHSGHKKWFWRRGKDIRSPCYFSENPVPYFCRASCWQPGTRTPTPPQISEDCLYLNVFVPENLVSEEALAVLSGESSGSPVPTVPGLYGTCAPTALSLMALSSLVRVKSKQEDLRASEEGSHVRCMKMKC